MIKFILVFFAAIVVDWIWAEYIIYTSKKEAVKSAFFSSLIVLVGAFMTLSYLEDHRAIISMALGAFIGTYISVSRSKAKDSALLPEPANADESVSE